MLLAMANQPLHLVNSPGTYPHGTVSRLPAASPLFRAELQRRLGNPSSRRQIHPLPLDQVFLIDAEEALPNQLVNYKFERHCDYAILLVNDQRKRLRLHRNIPENKPGMK